MDYSHVDLNNIFEHHPHINGRFQIKQSFYYIFIPDVIEDYEALLNCNLLIRDYAVSISGSAPIICLWLDTWNDKS